MTLTVKSAKRRVGLPCQFKVAVPTPGSRAKASSIRLKPAMIHGCLILRYIQSDNKRKAQAAYDTFMKLASPSEPATLKNHRDWSRVLAELSVRE